MAIVAIAIGFHAVPPYAASTPMASRIPINETFSSHMLWLGLHAVPSGLALIIGPARRIGSPTSQSIMEGPCSRETYAPSPPVRSKTRFLLAVQQPRGHRNKCSYGLV